jgi:thymidylate synthase (FAD)
MGRHKDILDHKDIKLINYLVDNKHTSTFEHNIITFRIKVPLFTARQHHRHRTWSYNEISRRYTEVDFRFYEPKSFRTQHKSNRQASYSDELIDPLIDPEGISGGNNASYLVHKHHKACLKLYNKLIVNGICREQARGVLPQNMYTEYYGTTNLSNLLKFIDLRTHHGAQKEIQQLALGMLNIARALWPVAISAYDKGKEK